MKKMYPVISIIRCSISVALSCLVVIAAVLPALAESADHTDTRNTGASAHNLSADVDSNDSGMLSYQEYTDLWSEKLPGSGRVVLNADTAKGSSKAQSYEGKNGVLLLDENSGESEYQFSVPSDGLYTLNAIYFPVANGSNLDINVSFEIDHKIPFSEAETVYLSKIYSNETAVTQDSTGNDLRPAQVEKPEWMEEKFLDKSGFNPDAFEIFLTAGGHTLTFSVTQSSIALSSIVVEAAEVLPSYADKQKEYIAKNFKKIKNYINEIEAETSDKKSSSSIYPDNNRASAATNPANPSYLRLNVISSSKPGDWMSWTVTVPEDGLYQLGFRVLQDANRGMTSTRRLSIDGEVPFQEANAVEFPFSTGWYNYIAGGKENPWLFYLPEGRHTIRLECTTGRFASTLNVVQQAVYELNTICREITMVIGISPDVYRDFDFKNEIPNLEKDMKAVRDRLTVEIQRLNKEMNYQGSELVTVEDIIRQLNSFIDNPRTIASRLSNFRTNISSLGTWLLNMTSQSLTMDTVVLFSDDKSMRKASAGFLQQISYDAEAVIGSFMIDYNSIGVRNNKNTKRVTAWVTTGRDQANIIRRLIDDKFSSKNNIAVNLSLVGDSATLLQATLAGKGPDIALFVEKTLPVNLAARGALTDLSEFDGFDQITNRFSPSAMIPYAFRGGYYALPNSQGFNVMFIRTDIFNELGIEIPKTWDDFYRILPVIQRNNMQVGAGGDAQSIFETLILQNGGKFYQDDLKSTDFDSHEVLTAFQKWTGFYKEYSLSLTYDAFSYFRSGIMPLVIADYTLYNQFTVAAPEIKGLWTIAPIPGTIREKNAVNRAESATGTASILMSSAKDKQASFKFLDWWTSTETQKRYSLELEEKMGAAARYNSANQEAVGLLSWKSDEYATIKEQWKSVLDIPSIPSSYYVTRNVTNAFRNVVYNGKNERETLNKYSEIINKEIKRKNKEMGIG